MNGSTPAREIRAADLAKNTEAFRLCLSGMIASGFKPKVAVDVRYGLGGWAVALAAQLPDTVVLGYEADEETFKRAARPDKVQLFRQKYENEPLIGVGLLMADFNTLTLLKCDDLHAVISATAPEYVIFTDVACSKLHLNYRSYGLKRPDLGGYYQEWEKKLPDFKFLRWERRHHAASTSLWRRRI